jgi:hypothetical protein
LKIPSDFGHLNDKNPNSNPSFKSMKLRNLIAAVVIFAAGNTYAASGIFESYGIVKINASTSYYDMQAATGNPDFQGASFGSFDTSVGNTLTLVGGEIKTFKNGLSNVTGAFFDYRVFKVGNTPGSFIEFSLPFDSNIGGGDQKWDNTGENVNLLTGLSNGNYTLEVFARATSSDGTHFSNNGGANFKASFTVIPEPSAALLGGISMLAMLRRRRA